MASTALKTSRSFAQNAPQLKKRGEYGGKRKKTESKK
jgi:hypothetical protein